MKKLAKKFRKLKADKRQDFERRAQDEMDIYLQSLADKGSQQPSTSAAATTAVSTESDPIEEIDDHRRSPSKKKSKKMKREVSSDHDFDEYMNAITNEIAQGSIPPPPKNSKKSRDEWLG